MPRPLKVTLAALAVAALGAAVALVVESAQRERAALGITAPGEPFAPWSPRPGVAAPEASGQPALLPGESTTPIRAADPPPAPGEGTGTGASERNGPSVGPDPARSGQPVVAAYPTARDTPDEPPDEGTGVPDDQNPHAPGEQPAGPNPAPEEAFFARIDQAYRTAVTGLADCVAGLADDARDSVFVEMVVRENEERRGVGTASVEAFQSALLTGDRAVCARRNVTGVDFPAPWEAHTGEGPAFTVRSSTAVEYSVVFEIEIGAE